MVVLVVIGTKTFPSVEPIKTLEIEEVVIDPDFRGDFVEEKARENEMYYENENLNGLQFMYDAMGYIAPNSIKEDVLSQMRGSLIKLIQGHTHSTPSNAVTITVFWNVI